MSAIDTTLAERGQRYGEFEEHARITQNIKTAMGDSPNWENLDPDMAEALEMVAHKIGRILNGDPNYLDSWHDIVGYVRLVEQRLEKAQNAQNAKSVNAAEEKTQDPSFSEAMVAVLRAHFGENVEIRFIGEDSGEI